MNLENVEDIYQLSPTQEGMLFHCLHSPELALYFEQSIFNLSDAYDITIFEQAWQQAIDHHPILRSAFFWRDLDKPLQVVYRHVKLTSHVGRQLAKAYQGLSKKTLTVGWGDGLSPVARLVRRWLYHMRHSD